MSGRNIRGAPPVITEGVADDLRKLAKIPTPSGPLWDAIKSHYGLPDPRRIDNVLSEITLPPGWKMGIDPNNPYNRRTVIIDHTDQIIGNIFFKDTYYNRCGSTTFYEERLQELGIDV